MRTKRARSASALCRIITTVVLLVGACLAVPGANQPNSWKFAVIEDTRDRVTDAATGISPDLHAPAEAVAAEKPELVLHTGDLCNGYYTTATSPMHGRFALLLRNWKAAVRPLYDYW